MMKACATLPAGRAAASRDIQPLLVLVNGVAERRLMVRRYECAGPLDQRTFAVCAVAGGQCDIDVQDITRWETADVRIVKPGRLIDGQTRYTILGQGRLRAVKTRLAAGVDQMEFELLDQWSERLAKCIGEVWWQTPAGDMVVSDQKVKLLAGGQGNRSQDRFSIGGRDVYLLQQQGEPWTVVDVLQSISALAKLDLDTHLLSYSVKSSPLVESLDMAQPVGCILRKLLDSCRLTIQRDVTMTGRQVIERRVVRAAGQGRRVKLPWSRDGQGIAGVVRIDRSKPITRPQQFIARAMGWKIESTFELARGWDVSLEGAADTSYDQTASDDFAKYSNVYRLWVLNEDGRFTDGPIFAGPKFDLAGFFDLVSVAPQPLRFLDNLTLDDSGAPRRPIVEMSIDGGNNWQTYPGSARMCDEYAGIYLDDAVLPNDFFAAAKIGNARIRMTASLRSPAAVTASRWRGNPFAGAGSSRIFELGDSFKFQKVAATSRHYQDICDGVLSADEVDQSIQLRSWLLDQTLEADHDRGQMTVELQGQHVLLRPGDRLENKVLSRTRLMAGGGGESVIVEKITCNWPSVGENITGGTLGGQPGTIVKISY